MKADGSAKRCLGVSGSGPTWAPDGTRLVFTSMGAVGVINLNQKTKRSTPACVACDGDNPDWSPDGTRIVAVSHSSIWVFAIGSSKSARLTRPSRNYNDDSPRWSPDGRRILFVRGGLGMHPPAAGLYSVDPDGNGLTRIVSGPDIYVADWSPDGRSVAWTQLNNTIHILDLDTKHVRVLKLPAAGGDPGDLDW